MLCFHATREPMLGRRACQAGTHSKAPAYARPPHVRQPMLGSCQAYPHRAGAVRPRSRPRINNRPPDLWGPVRVKSGRSGLLFYSYGFAFVYRFNPVCVLGILATNDFLIDLSQLAGDGAHLAGSDVAEIYPGNGCYLGRCSGQE